MDLQTKLGQSGYTQAVEELAIAKQLRDHIRADVGDKAAGPRRNG